MRKFILPFLFVASVLVSACTDDDGSRNALESMGFTDVQLTGWEAFGCSDDDNFATGFKAKNPQGRRVSGVVCCGVWKNCTVRF